MSDYIKATNFATKDSLSTGNPNKIIKGTEIDTEFNAIASAVASKSDINSPTFTGIPAAPTASAGTNTTQVSTTAFVTAATIAERTATATLTNKTLTSPTISGGSISGITDLAVADGGTGASTLAANNVLLGNGTSTLQTVAPSTTGNFLRSNGTTWISEAVSVGGGSVTSIATGNGLSGGTITSSGTLVVACPSFNTVGSYCFGGSYFNQSYSGGNTFSAGTGTNEVQPFFVADDGSNARLKSASSLSLTQLSGTWRLMSCIGLSGIGTDSASLFCRVS
jgi:hypothetical protein